MSYNKNHLISLIREKSALFGEFRLASGQISTYYIDLSKVVMLKKGLQQIIWGIGNCGKFDSIGGPAMGAIPLVSALMLNMDISRSFFIRKESKEHGKRDLIEGNLQKGDNVLMIEDVTTTGTSLLNAIEEVERQGGIVKQVFSVLDRESGAKELFQNKGYPFTSLLTISDILGNTAAVPFRF